MAKKPAAKRVKKPIKRAKKPDEYIFYSGYTELILVKDEKDDQNG